MTAVKFPAAAMRDNERFPEVDVVDRVASWWDLKRQCRDHVIFRNIVDIQLIPHQPKRTLPGCRDDGRTPPMTSFGTSPYFWSLKVDCYHTYRLSY